MESVDVNRQNKKRKIIKAVLNSDARILAEDTVELSDDEIRRFYRMTVTGGIKRKNFDEIIRGIKGPDADTAFSEIERSKFKKRILAYMAGLGFDNFEQVSKSTVETFLEKYQNPGDFESAENDFLEMVKQSNPAEKYIEYKKEMNEYVQAVYGKKEEYAELIKELIRDAEEWQSDQEAEKLELEFLPTAEIAGDPWIQGGKNYV